MKTQSKLSDLMQSDPVINAIHHKRLQLHLKEILRRIIELEEELEYWKQKTQGIDIRPPKKRRALV